MVRIILTASACLSRRQRFENRAKKKPNSQEEGPRAVPTPKATKATVKGDTAVLL